ncbi:hypothetical protein ACHGLA_00910 [Streptomyces sp. YH02]|uniref:hypothetical protein n=1 Tax=Streptomyces sp. YH02 TaxID=3256999 RepID=UPI0037580001
MAIETGTYDRELATRLARRAVAEAAPDELAQFELTARAFHSAPEHRRFGGGRRAGEPLGLGLETVSAMLGTVALAAAVQVLAHLAQQAAGHVVDTARQGLLSRLRRLRRRGEPEQQSVAALPSPEPLTAAQLADLRRVARETALRLRVPEDAARAIADGIVAELAIVTATPTATPTATSTPTPSATATTEPGAGAESGPEPVSIAQPLSDAGPAGPRASVVHDATTMATGSSDADTGTGSTIAAAAAAPTPGSGAPTGYGGAAVDANEPDGPGAAPAGAGAGG